MRRVLDVVWIELARGLVMRVSGDLVELIEEPRRVGVNIGDPRELPAEDATRRPVACEDRIARIRRSLLAVDEQRAVAVVDLEVVVGDTRAATKDVRERAL